MSSRGSEVSDAEVSSVAHALSDPTRVGMVRLLLRDGERACGTFSVQVSASTLSHHFTVLREAGVIEQRPEGNRRMNRIAPGFRERFPGIVADLIP